MFTACRRVGSEEGWCRGGVAGPHSQRGLRNGNGIGGGVGGTGTGTGAEEVAKEIRNGST